MNTNNSFHDFQAVERELDSLSRILAQTQAQIRAREAEAAAMLGPGGLSNLFDDPSSVTADALKHHTALFLAEKAVSQVRARAAVLMPLLAAEIGRIAGSVEAQHRANLKLILGRVAALFSGQFAEEDCLQSVLLRTVQVRDELHFQDTHRTHGTSLRFELGEGGAHVLAADTQPAAVLSIYRHALTVEKEVLAHTARLSQQGGGRS